MTGCSRATLAADLAECAFAGPISGTLTPRRIGAEVELIPVEAGTGRRCAIDDDERLSTLPFFRRFGSRQGWLEASTPKGTPCFHLPAGGTVTFEPGGQVEYSSPPCGSASSLLALLRSVVLPLRSAASAEGIDLLTVGIDPFNRVEEVPLQLHVKRYARMAEYFARLSSAGARMMRQTAAFQLSLDFDDEPWLRWRVLNAAAPYVVAIFANSPVYAGARTDHLSARAHTWRMLDPGRTGLPYDAADPIEAYLDFALHAPAILFPTLDGMHRPFGDWLALASPTRDEWRDHLSTLFPEVRPRGHLELRSADAIGPEWYAAPLALTTGLLYDSRALREAAELLGTPDMGLLDLAGRSGLRHQPLARTAVDLFELALMGCAGLGPRYFHPSDLEQARTFFERYTRRGRSPADDAAQDAIAA